MEKPEIFVFDFDSVMGDLGTAWLGRYNRDYDDNLTNADITRWATHEFVKPECGLKIYDYLEDPTLYDEVKPIPGAIEAFHEVKEAGYRAIVATSTPNGSAGRKLSLLREWGVFPQRRVEPDYFECHDKSRLGDVLIDDGPHNIQAFKGVAVVFDQPHNRDLNWPYRVCGWDDFRQWFKEKRWLHPTELKRPEQVKRFREILDEMYITHLEKNFDYSPANILGTGQIGLVTRIWDKTSRLMNLTGFRIEIASSTYEQPLQPKNESIKDTVMDLAVYSIIHQINEEGKWGK